jgi:hypothetical protein
MHMQYFGDSYDIVKQSLIRWLGTFGDWSVHPMLTQSATAQQVEAFERFLGARMICRDELTTSTNRESYLSCATQCGNLFLDPDTGLSLRETGLRKPKTKYLFAREFVQLVEQRPKALTLVFDQSLPRGKEGPCMEHKLQELRAKGVHCFVYMSHACFILGGREEVLVRHAFDRVISESKLPGARFVSGTASISGSVPESLLPGRA